MENLLSYLITFAQILFFTFIFSGTIHILLHIIGIWDKIAINIKLPKRKKYKTKVNPIYEFVDSHISGYCIRKWEIGYDNSFGLLIFMIIVPYPINILKYGYNQVGVISVPDETKLEDIDENLGEIYERIWKEKNNKIIESQRKEKERRDNLDRINKVFNDNYEK